MAEDWGRIQSTLLDLKRRVEALEKRQETPYRGTQAGGDGEVPPAKDSELDSQYGDPNVHKDPKTWKGDSQVGRKYSECEPEFLLMLARSLEWKAQKFDEEGLKDGKGRPQSHWPRKDAARARGWARRKVAGWELPKTEELPPETPATHGVLAEDDDDEIPF